MADIEDRLKQLECRFEQALAHESRLAALESQVGQITRKSTVRDWLQTLGPYLGGIIVLIVGFWLKDSVTLALQREQLDLEYVKQMRDLILDFDAATEQAAADANAIGLAMYGRHAVAPLIERLRGGDVAKLAAERGLYLAATNDPAGVCPRITHLLAEPAGQLTWQNGKTLVRVIAAADCVQSRATLERELARIASIQQNPEQLVAFAAGFANASSVDIEATDSLAAELRGAIERLARTRDDATEPGAAWWR